jgi:predicted dithiol-disulfide oxidoreductase (DUF899 family)
VKLPPIVSPAEWNAAREELLVKEKELTRAQDALAAERRRLPMVKIDKEYVFDGPDGKASLVDLFEGRSQLIVYHFMWLDEPGTYCEGCASMTDNVPLLAHLHARDISFGQVSRGPLAELIPYWQRMGWRNAPFYSCAETTFQDDMVGNNGFGISAFLRDGNDVYRTYYTTSRGADRLRMDFNLMDLAPYGRQETWEDSPAGWPQSAPYEWWRLHDEYEKA